MSSSSPTGGDAETTTDQPMASELQAGVAQADHDNIADWINSGRAEAETANTMGQEEARRSLRSC
jgi:hypothetical protein